MSARAIIPTNALLESEMLGGGTSVRRLLFVDADAGEAALIDVGDPNAMPEWESLCSLQDGFDCGAIRIREHDEWQADTRPEAALSEASRRVRDERFLVLRPLVDLAADPQQGILRAPIRGPLVLAAALESGKALDKLYKWLRQYWQRGQVANALLPGFGRCGGRGKQKAAGERKRGRPSKLALAEPGREGMNVTERVRQLIVKGGTRYWKKRYRGKRLTLREAHQATLETFFYARLAYQGNNLVPILKEEGELPTYRQFCYWLGKARETERDLVARFGERRHALRTRAVLGSSEHLSRGPNDLYLIDATVGDIYLLSSLNRKHVIGRPVIYLVVDHFSRMIVGFYVGLEGPSWVGSMMALENAFTDKVAFCAKYGIEITPEEWPCHYIPRAITADRGEMIAIPSDHLVSAFGLRISNTPPFRADFKSFVELQFRLSNEQGIRRQPGWVDKLAGRGDPDYRLDATLDLYHFNRLMIELVLHNNRARRLMSLVPPDYPLSDDMDPVPLDLWKWGMETRVGIGRTMDRDRVRVNLLPSEEATATPEGITVNGLHYDSATGRERGWFLRVPGRERVRVSVAYDPRDVSKVYLRLDNGRTIEECPLTDKDAIRYLGKTLEEVQDAGDRRLVARQRDRRTRHQDVAELNARLEAITREAAGERAEELGSKPPTVTDINEARRAQRRVVQAREAFTRGATLPPAPPRPAAADGYVPFPD